MSKMVLLPRSLVERAIEVLNEVHTGSDFERECHQVAEQLEHVMNGRCIHCGESLKGNGITTPLACERADTVNACVEDGPHYCNPDEV